MALQAPGPGKEDPRMQTLVYSPGQIIYLHLVVGHTLTVVLPPTQSPADSFGSDTAHLKVVLTTGTNLAVLKPIAIMPAKSFFIRATQQDGSPALYTFQVDVVDPTGNSQDPYTLTLRDPGADAAAKAATWRQWRAQQDDRAKRAELAAAANGANDTNVKYVLQGKEVADWDLLPTREVGDDGKWTHFHLPQARSPLIYTVSPDGKDTVPDCTPNSETHVTTCHQLARQWRLRDGDAELCVFNKDFDPVGAQTPSNTSSPAIERTLKASAQ
jgi:type IV secretion system protein VirB9